MGKNHKVNINRNGITLKIEIKDATYRAVHRGSYRLNNKRDLFNLLSVLEKYSTYTISQVINWKNDWI